MKQRTPFRTVVCIGIATLSLQASAELPDAVARALKQAKIPESNVALWVAPANVSSAGSGSILQHNANVPLNPASVMKTLTTFAALDTLGPAFTWTTEVYTQGDLRNGVLTGNLIFRGGGDPALTWDRFGQLIRDIKSRGLREIRGDLIIDHSLFGSSQPATDFDDQPLRAYNATPEALLVNFKSLSFRLSPVAANLVVKIDPLIPFSPLIIDNQLRSVGGACPNWRGGINERLDSHEQGVRFTVTGSMPASCGERILHITDQDGPRLAGGVFRALWQELGGKWEGAVRQGQLSADAQLLTSWKSPPLADVMRDINKFSNNVMARQLFLTLGTRDGTQLTSVTQSEQALRGWLQTKQLELPGLLLDNGSGLSRSERITAKGLASLLQLAWQSPFMPEFTASLPLAGVDGTARRRFENQSISGRAYLKTGSLNDVMSMAGYVLDAQNHWQIVVMFVNDIHADLAEPAFLKFADWVYQRPKR